MTDVEKTIPQIAIGDTSVIGSDEVESYIEMVEAEINGILAGKNFVVPVTEENAVKVLRSLALPGVLYRIFVGLGSRRGLASSREEGSREYAERTAFKNNKEMLMRDGVAEAMLSGASIDELASQGPTITVTDEDVFDSAATFHEYIERQQILHDDVLSSFRTR